MSMEQSGGEVAAKRVKASESDAGAGGEDRISALPDDALVLILLCLGTKAAGRTSVLSHRWRHVWTLLPELRFGVARDPHLLRDALSASEVPLRCLHVGYPNASPPSLAAWLPAAARRVSGELLLVNMDLGRGVTHGEEEPEASRTGTFELPCFEKATSIRVHLGFLGLSVPPAGVFSRLTNLDFNRVRFHGPDELGAVVSSPRCPCLQNLTIRDTQGLDSITIDSGSLQRLELRDLRGLRQVTVVAPALKDLRLLRCFFHGPNQPLVNLSAPQLRLLKWADAYDPSSVHLGSIKCLHTLATIMFVYGLDGLTDNRACFMLLPQFKAVDNLILSLGYMSEVDNYNWQYMMKDMTMLPHVTSLYLVLMAKGHAIGACLFHVLKICSGIKQLVLVFSSRLDLKEQTECSSGCICDQLTNWKIEELSLNCLQELEIERLRASDHEIAFVKRLLKWVPVLKMVTVTFHHSISESEAKELFQMFRSFSRLGLCMKFYIYQKFSKVLYTPEE